MTVTINGTRFDVPDGATVLSALYNSGQLTCRQSVQGEPRGGLCGMGICFECRVTIDGIPHQRACMVSCREGMEISTDA